ncbi:MAG: hypothetical protein CJBNEKGG_03022 [Prosthecobacter sp.]|nr:hypothetical protein [Prosthecobacter sp.]
MINFKNPKTQSLPMKQPFLQRILTCLGLLILHTSAAHAGILLSNHPVNTTVTDGTTLTLQVTASSTSVPANPLIYQWFKQNGANFDPASSPGTSNKLVIPKVTAANAGVYRVEISETNQNPAVTVTSNTATVTVITSPKIIQQPVAPTVMKRDGDSVDFTVTIDPASTPDFTYAWQKKVGSTYVTQRTVTNAALTDTFTINNLTLADAGTYRVRISSTLSTVVAISKDIVLKLNSRPVITTSHAPALNIAFGASGTLKVVAAGNSPMTFEWLKNNVPIPKSNKSSLTIKGNDNLAGGVAEGPGQYRVRITNIYTPDVETDTPVYTESVASVVRVIRKPKIATQPEKKKDINIVGGPAAHSFSVVMDATGNDVGTFTYQWFKDNKPYGGPGSATSTINFPSVIWQDRGSYKVLIRNEVGSVTSTPGVLNVISPPLIISQSTGPVFGATKGSVKVNVVGGGTAPLKFEWFFKPVGAPDYGANVVGKTATLSLSALKTTNTGEYKCVVTSTAKPSLGSVESVPVFVQVDDAPKIVTQTKVDGTDTPSTSIMLNNKLHLLVVASGTHRPAATPDAPANPLKYQWQKNNVDITGATSPDFVIDNAVVADTGKYRCIVSNFSGTAISNSLSVIVSGPPVAVIQPSATAGGIEEAKVETAVGFTATHPTPVKYKWQRRSGAAAPFTWSDVAGKTTQKLTFTKVRITDDGTYRCAAYNVFGETYSNDVVVSVLPIPSATLGPKPGVSTVEFFPQRAMAGDKVRLFGSNLNYVAEAYFGDKRATFVQESNDSLLLTVPSDAPTVPTAIKVVTKGKDSTSVGGGETLTTNLFERTLTYVNDLSNATILPGASGTSIIRPGDNTVVSLIDFVGRVFYYIRVPKRSTVIIGCDGDYVASAGTYMDPALQVWRQGPGSNRGPEGVVTFPQAFQSASNIIGNISEQVAFNTDFDDQYLLVMVFSSNPVGIGLTGVGAFHLTVNITALSSSSSTIPTASASSAKSSTEDASSWDSSAEAVLTALDDSSGKALRFGGSQQSGSEPVVIWSDKVGDALDASGHVTAGFTMSLEAGAAGGDDQFSWQVSDSTGKSMGALWVDTASGGIRLVEPDGTVHAATQRMTPGAGAHYFVIDVDGESSSWTVSMDGVTLTKPVPLEKGGSYGEIFGVWDLGADATASGASIIFKDFRISGSR